MNIRKYRHALKVIAIWMMIQIVGTVVFPTVSWALTSGPGAPEFSSFEPVATTDMVNVQSGAFTYNLPALQIPGADGGGYALSLSYHSGASIEEESSWVGNGWTLNPGAINRTVRGFADEYKNTDITYYNKTRPNWTLTSSGSLNLEFFSQDELTKAADAAKKGLEYSPVSRFTSVSVSQALRFNNYQGYNRSYSIGAGFKGAGSLNMQIGASGITFSANVNPIGLISKALKKKKKKDTESTTSEPNTTKEKEEKNWSDYTKKEKMKTRVKNVFNRIKNPGFNLAGSDYGLFTYAEASYASAVQDYTGFGLNFSGSAEVNPALAPVGIEVGVSGGFHMQTNREKTTMHTYGYMNHPTRNDKSKDDKMMMDYYVEKESSFDKRDYLLGIPFSNPDVFHVTGEGLGGGFRAYTPKAGTYYPNFEKSSYPIFNTGVEFAAGTNVGVGLDFGFGVQSTESQLWPREGGTPSLQFSSAPPVFRFNNDLGGKVEYGNTDLLTASVSSASDFPGTKNASPGVNGFPTGYINGSSAGNYDQSVGRSSYIAPELDGSGSLEAFTNFNEDGMRYHYGQPAYIHKEASLSIAVDPQGDEIRDDYLAYRSLNLNSGYDVATGNHDMVVGQVKKENAAYAYSFLLTEITTPDYMDVDNNGPSQDDLGGWTKFSYTHPHSDYRYRLPYTGLNYDRGSISDIKDDAGSLSTGEKDIFYLETIETKTHIARFRLSDRQDGLGAAALGGSDPSATSDQAKDTSKRLKKLDKIDLYYKNADGTEHLIKSVLFEYDYSLAPNVPNNSGDAETTKYGTTNINQNKGKLTLKKVWFEYEGLTNAKISPYRFNYTYKPAVEYSSEVKSRYPELNDPDSPFFNLSSKYSDAMQNPDYNPNYLDSWGAYSAGGQHQHQEDRGWIWQGDISDQYYDPGAWQLKQIILPSGGEILVEYEQTDYSNVQDRPTMALAHITNSSDGYGDDQTYTVDLTDVGIELDGSETSATIAERMREYYKSVDDGGEGRRIYWKFLYALKGEAPNLHNCKSDYVSGYSKVVDIQPSGATAISITLDGTGSDYDGYDMVPRQGCYDFVSTQRVGKYEWGCESKWEAIYDGVVGDIASNYGNADEPFGKNVLDFLATFGFAVTAMASMHATSLIDFKIQPPTKGSVCKAIDPEHSYFKVFMPKDKRGGGLRVKRLLTYDQGLETGDAVMYGSEYKYINEDGSSSGVASTEPGTMREENPLVAYLPKGQQNWFSRHTVGKDKEQTEGPIGESILPSPSVTHGRVIVKNIYQGETSNGFEVREFYTCKDYPYDKIYNYTPTANSQYDFTTEKGMEYTDLAGNTVIDPLLIPAGLITYQTNKMWAGQGFRFIMNSMPGQSKSSKKYGGKYSDFLTDPTKVYLAGAETQEYFQPGEQMLMLESNNGSVSAKWDTPGKEMDLAMEMKSVKDKTMDFSLEIDLSVSTTFPPPIFVGLWPTFEYTEKMLNTHMTSKVIRYPAVMKAQQVYQDGIWSKTEFLAFDEQTGQSIVTKTTDAYHEIPVGGQPHDGSMYALTIPAHWHYEDMGQKALNVQNTNQMSASAGAITTYGAGANPVEGGVFNIDQSKVLNASAQTWSDQFTGLAGIWKPLGTYAYKTTRQEHAEGNLLQNAGVFDDYAVFNYADPSTRDPKWLELNVVTQYNENGQAVEERNILDVYSASKFGYDLTVPTMIAQNAQEDQIFFEDYELTGNANIAHSGAFSYQMPSASEQLVTGIDVSHNMVDEGALLQFWAKVTGGHDPDFELALGNSGVTISGEKTAQTGEWILYRFEIKPEQLLPLSGQSLNLTLNADLGIGSVCLDDVRFQPAEAEAICYVYDKFTLRLLAQFDDQHFGRFYQYNAEGKLIRKLIETERGMRTIQEAHYNTPDEFRN